MFCYDEQEIVGILNPGGHQNPVGGFTTHRYLPVSPGFWSPENWLERSGHSGIRILMILAGNLVCALLKNQ